MAKRARNATDENDDDDDDVCWRVSDYNAFIRVCRIRICPMEEAASYFHASELETRTRT